MASRLTTEHLGQSFLLSLISLLIYVERDFPISVGHGPGRICCWGHVETIKIGLAKATRVDGGW